MRANEAAAHELVERLRKAGVGAQVSGGGVHWRVDVTPVGSRSVRVHCFVHDVPGRARPTPDGIEYLVLVLDGERRVADGRTAVAPDVVRCARAWTNGGTLAELAIETPFIDAKKRALHALAQGLDPRLRREHGEDPRHELWVYQDGRTCELALVDEAVECRFYLGPAEVAQAVAVPDVQAAVARWLLDRISVGSLATELAGVRLEPHAEVLETDPARWHWLRLVERIRDPDDVLAPLRELVEALARGTVATGFFSFSSMGSLCFSASSHHPFVTDGLPAVSPAGAGSYEIDGQACDLEGAVRAIEAKLAASQVEPFFGTALQLRYRPLAEQLARHDGSLRPVLVQERTTYRIEVACTNGLGTCRIRDREVEFARGDERVMIAWARLEGAIPAIVRFCAGGATIEEIAADLPAGRVLRPRS